MSETKTTKRLGYGIKLKDISVDAGLLLAFFKRHFPALYARMESFAELVEEGDYISSSLPWGKPDLNNPSHLYLIFLEWLDRFVRKDQFYMDDEDREEISKDMFTNHCFEHPGFGLILFAELSKINSDVALVEYDEDWSRDFIYFDTEHFALDEIKAVLKDVQEELQVEFQLKPI